MLIMKDKLSKVLLPMAAILASTAMGLAATNPASAASMAKVKGPLVKTVTPTSVPVRGILSVTLSMQQFNRRVATLPELASLQAGDRVILNDNGSVTNSVWQGTYVFHPAGSLVQPGPMYARWKDGVVAMTLTPATSKSPVPGTLNASFVEQRNGKPNQAIKTLINDHADRNVLRIPDNAWLFRVDSNGQYTALVDVFVFQSGGQPVPLQYLQKGGILPALTGSQPVPISAGAANAN